MSILKWLNKLHKRICKFQVGVTLLVIIMYVLNVWVELLCTAISDKITVKLNRPKPPDIEDLDPAILVGSFKRYK